MIFTHRNQPGASRRERGNTGGKDRGRISRYTFFIGIGLVLLMVVPVCAGTVYMDGSPQISASISGSNEVNPGDAVNLTVMVKNTGLNAEKLVAASNADREAPPNMAQFLTVTLLKGDAPVTVKSDPQALGDLPGGGNATAKFSLKVNNGAAAGTYVIPLAYSYSYQYASSIFDNSTIENLYRHVDGTTDIALTIKPDVTVNVLSVVPESLNAGTSGYIDMKIQNAGSDFGQKSVVMVLRNGNSPIQPNDSSVYIGDFPPGSVASCRYRVFVSSDAQPQVYPADVVVVYQNSEGDYVTSRSDTIGIPVGGKVDFAIVSDPVVINPGNKKLVAVEYRNTGGAAVYGAQARIIAVDPFTTGDDISNLGDLQPGESAVAKFGLTADRAATIKEYGLDSEIRYRDAVNNSYVSDAIDVRVIVTKASGLSSILSNPVYLSITVIAIIALIALVFRFRAKIRQRMEMQFRKK